MGNPYRGEVSFEAFGEMWTLQFGANAFAEFEGLTGAKLHNLGDGAGLTELRALVYAGLGKHHRRKRGTLENVGDMIDEVGPTEMSGLVQKAISLAYPQPEGDGKSPLEAAQTRDGSTS